MHVPLGPHLPKRQGFGIRFIGLPLERGDLRIKDPLRNVRAEEDKFVSANTEKIPKKVRIIPVLYTRDDFTT